MGALIKTFKQFSLAYCAIRGVSEIIMNTNDLYDNKHYFGADLQNIQESAQKLNKMLLFFRNYLLRTCPFSEFIITCELSILSTRNIYDHITDCGSTCKQIRI